MLQRLSATSHYICDLNRGPIEPANRMASRSSNKLTTLLEPKESTSKTRAPLKLLGLEEISIDSTMIANDINASLQPVWYTEQTIIDDHPVQQEDNHSMIQEKSRTNLMHSTLTPIQSESGLNNEEDEVAVEPLASEPSLMHKSSTFTIESPMNMESGLHDLEKENVNQEDLMPSMTVPSDESFRALEHLLGLGSGTTTIRESPKLNHDTLSLTVVTPTDIVNSTRRSSRLSLAHKTITDSLPASQELPKMPTIESITSTTLPSFLADNTAIADEQPSTTIDQQDSFDLTENNSKNDDEGNFSFELNDFTNSTKNESMMTVPEPEGQPMIAMRAPTCADVAYRALIKPRTNGRVSQPIKAESPLAVTNKARSSAPASRFLRSSCRRISSDSAAQNSVVQEQPTTTECFINKDVETNMEKQQNLVEIVTVPEEDEIEQEKSISVTLNLNSPKQTNHNLSKQADETYQSVASEQEQLGTPTKELAPLLSREYTYNTPKRRSSQRGRSMLNATTNSSIPIQQKTMNEEETSSSSIASKSMLNVLLTQQATERRTTKSPSIASKSMLNVLLTERPTEETILLPMKSAVNSPSIVSKSMLGVLLTQPTETPARTSTRKSKALTPVSSIVNSPSIASESMLGILLTKPTQTEARPSKRNSKILTPSKSALSSPSIASQSMLGVLLSQPTDGEQSILQDTSIKPSSKRISSRASKRLSTNLTPRVGINPLHSSTPSTTRHQSLQLVSIGEQEQVSTTVPTQQEMDIMQLHDSMQSVRKSTPPSRTMDAGVQTTPSLNYVSRRYFDSIDQESISILEINKSSSSVIVEEKQITPLQTKIIMNLKRNVRFQLTPTTDARLAEKEKLEEGLRGLKPDIVINPTPAIVPQVIEVKKPVKRLKKSKKKLLTSRKKKTVSNKKPQEVKPVSPNKESNTKVQSVPSKQGAPQKRAGAEVNVEPIAAKRSKTLKTAEVRATSSKAQTASTNNKKSKVVESTKRQRSVSKTNEKKQKKEVTKVEKPERKRSNASKTKKAESKEEKSVIIKVDKPVSKRVATKQTRSASTNVKENTIEEKSSVSVSNENTKVEVVETKTRSLKSKKKTKSELIEKPQDAVSTKNKSEPTEKKRNASLKTKHTTVEPTNKRESRAQSRAAHNKKEIIQPVEKKAIEPIKESKKTENKIVEKVEIKQDQSEKFDELTVAELKSRLIKQKHDIPKGAKKADLIALLMKTQTNVGKEQKSVEAPIVRTTRRHKK